MTMTPIITLTDIMNIVWITFLVGFFSGGVVMIWIGKKRSGK